MYTKIKGRLISVSDREAIVEIPGKDFHLAVTMRPITGFGGYHFNDWKLHQDVEIEIANSCIEPYQEVIN